MTTSKPAESPETPPSALDSPPSAVALPGHRQRGHLRNFPPPETWDSHVAYDAKAHPRKVPHEYMLIPTTCFNCESACGLLAHVDKEDLSVKRLEGNPAHPGSRGRNCAKGRRRSTSSTNRTVSCTR